MKKPDAFDKYFGYYLLFVGIIGIITSLIFLTTIYKDYLNYLEPYTLPIFCFINIVTGYNILIGKKSYYFAALIFQIIQITSFNFNDKYIKISDQALSIGVSFRDGVLSQTNKFPDIEFTMSNQPIVDDIDINIFSLILSLLIIYRLYLKISIK